MKKSPTLRPDSLGQFPNGKGRGGSPSRKGLLDLDLLADLFGFDLLDLRDGDGQDAVLHLGGDVFAVRVLGEGTGLPDCHRGESR